MKLRFPISDFRFPIFKQSAKRPPFPGTSVAPASHHQPSALRPPAGRRGIALIITLIMLAVTLVMAVAFLALSRRERNAVSTTTDTATAQLATDSALAAAQAQIMASILATNAGAYNYGLLVSTNYINYQGYNPNGGPNGYGPASPTNVNYDYTLGGALLTAGERNQNIANLELLPRAPVYVVTNQQTGSNEFRFYLDLNRNGMDEPSSFVTNRDYLGNVIRDNNLNIVTNAQPGDPEWIGVLAHPDQPHGPDNQFVARYAFLAQPIGNSLDLNYIHNQSMGVGPGVSLANPDYYFRNEGVGSWELNLAAFLVDLNTNVWNPPTVGNPRVNNPYNYLRPFRSANTGVAFEDARSLLSWRYDFTYNSLATMGRALTDSGIDAFSVGSLMRSPVLPPPVYPSLNPHWPGSDNPNRYFSLPSDLFDANKVQPAGSIGFTNRLMSAGNSLATYDRYTFYRLLDQLGTDSSVDADRMNLNFRNVTNGVVVPGLETNLYPWTALDFFTNAADRLLRYSTAHWFAVNPTNYLATYYDITNFPNSISSTGYGLTNAYLGVTNAVPSFGVGNIPVYLNGKFIYRPAVNRLLQLAANMYDASTNKTSLWGKDYPSVFRPTFFKYRNGDVYIKGYAEIQRFRGNPDLNAYPFYPTLVSPDYLPVGDDNYADNLYGVPWIIGARKGFPAFNHFYMRNTVQVTRKLQVKRPNSNYHGATETNQMFTMSVTNRLGYSFWNSYNDTNFAPGTGLSLAVRDTISMTLSNGADGSIYQTFPGTFNKSPFTFSTNLTYWPGSGWTLDNVNPLYQTPQARSFISGYWDFDFLPESSYLPASKRFYKIGTVGWEAGDTSAYPFPQMQLLTTNWIQAVILEDGHVIDYVALQGPNSHRRLDEEIADTRANDAAGIENNTAMWDTNQVAVPGPPQGEVNQITVSRFNPAGTIREFWKRPPNMPAALNTPDVESKYFDAFFTGGVVTYNGKVYPNTNTSLQAPYTPTRTMWQFTSWQANDPLVHYLASDLNTTNADVGIHRADWMLNAPYPNPNLNTVGDRYQPWGRNQQMSQFHNGVDSSAYDLRYRDPLVWRSDNWDFPTNKYPNIGWLGRVHRGTPWQTVYLKARNVLDATASFGNTNLPVGPATWALWTGDTQTVTHNGVSSYYDALNSGPIQDEALFDLFTTRFNDNAVRGALSVNQTHLASWSAVLSGVVALTNVTTLPTSYTPPAITNLIIEPAGLAGNNSALGEIVNGTNGINATRAGFVNADGVRGTFEHVGDILRVPALTEQSPFLNWNNQSQQQNGISDELYEWLPQQTLGLLRVGGAPRYVVYCYGQTLRPAVDGTLLSGPYFNMVTNYQVTAESAARAVIRVDRHVTATGTNYTTVVESYNPLPPN